MGKKNECDLQDEFRCKRRDKNKSWRCTNPRVPGKIHCEHHIAVQKDKYRRLKLKKKSSQHFHEIGITQRCIGDLGRIRKPQIAQRFAVPSEIFHLSSLSEVLTMDAWNNILSPADRYNLRSLLPREDMSDSLVESLLKGKIMRFGENPAKTWGQRVCKGEQSPDFLVRKENKLKL
ncbi:hypothetical protein KI387_003243, partial [Taxus chinensis]